MILEYFFRSIPRTDFKSFWTNPHFFAGIEIEGLHKITTYTFQFCTHRRGHNFKSGNCMATQLTQTSVEFYYLRVDT